jgi:hypothetical protein
MAIEDFTQLPEGSVVRCPKCGRNGVLKNPYAGQSSCIHAEEYTVLSDGMLTEPTDCCELPEA